MIEHIRLGRKSSGDLLFRKETKIGFDAANCQGEGEGFGELKHDD